MKCLPKQGLTLPWRNHAPYKAMQLNAGQTRGQMLIEASADPSTVPKEMITIPALAKKFCWRKKRKSTNGKHWRVSLTASPTMPLELLRVT